MIENIEDDYFKFYDSEKPVIRKTKIDGMECWHARHPENGCDFNSLLLGPKPPAAGHVVEEHHDGHITVRPSPPSDPGNSNSILCPVCGWHGYIREGDWYEI